MSVFDEAVAERPVDTGDVFSQAMAERPDAPETKSTVLQKVGNVLKTGGLAALKGVDWLSHLGQPQAAKDLVQRIATDPGGAPAHPEDAGKLPTWAEAMGQVAPGGVTPGLPPGMDTRPLEAAAVDMATSPASYLGLVGKIPGLGNMLRAAGKIPEAATTKIASELTGVSEPALQMASTGPGREALQTAAGQQGTIGKNLVDAIDHFENHIPEAAQVKQAVKQMPPVNIQPAIDALRNAKPTNITGTLSPEQAAVAGKIDQYIDFLKGGTPNGKFFKTRYPASDALDLRRVLDSPIDYATGLPNPKEVQGALFQARQALKDELLNAAAQSGNPEYKQAMEAWSQKLGILDDVKNAALGAGNDYSKQSRATFFVNSLFGKGVTAGQKQELIGKLDQVFGSDFLDQSKNARYAAELGEGGKPAFLPVQHTGRAALGATVGHFLGEIVGQGTAGAVAGGGMAALSSPAIATRVAIPATRLPPWLVAHLAAQGPAVGAAGSAARNLPPQLQGAQ